MNTGPGLRLDKWLWFTRLARTREAAASLCEGRHVRLSGRLVEKAHAPVRVGDIISLPRGSEVLVVRVLVLPQRRTGAADAMRCYESIWSSRDDAQAIEAPVQSRYDPAIQPPDWGA